MERRDFCVNACRFFSAAVATALLDGCASGHGMSPDDSTTSTNVSISRVNASVSSRTITLPLANAPSLSAVGGVALIVTSSVSVLVARRTEDEFAAVSAVCTHEGCTIDSFSGQTYVCRCHGSEFTTVGAVTHGPAQRSLDVYATEFVGTTLTIHV